MIILKFSSPDENLVFKMLEEQMKIVFETIVPVLLKKTAAGKLPLFISQNPLYQMIWKSTLDKYYGAHKKFNQFCFENVVKHRETLDKSNPRDFLGNKMGLINVNLFSRYDPY